MGFMRKGAFVHRMEHIRAVVNSTRFEVVVPVVIEALITDPMATKEWALETIATKKKAKHPEPDRA